MRARDGRNAKLADRLWPLVDRSGGPEACWPWRGGVNEDGYGRLMVDGKSYLAHRLALGLTQKALLRSNQVTRHRCVGNRLCSNPAHLMAGSVADNNADAARQDRVAFGERNPQAKLSEDQVQEIRRRAADMGYGKYELLGRLYGVTGRQIAYICAGEKWKRAGRRAA